MPFRELTANPIFIGGVPRSGTTLLRVILDSHPHICCGTELRVIHTLAALWANSWQTAEQQLHEGYGITAEEFSRLYRELIMSFLAPFWRQSGKPRIAEKTPANFLAFGELRRLFPDSPLIHVIRDGRDVVASRLAQDIKDNPTSDPLVFASRRAVEWANAMIARERLLADPGFASHYFELRYEDCVRSPRETLAPLFAFLGEPFDEKVLAFHSIVRNVAGTEEWSAAAVRRPLFIDSIGRWQRDFSPVMRDAVQTIAGAQLRRLGYLGEET